MPRYNVMITSFALFWSACTTIQKSDKPQPPKLTGYDLLKKDPTFEFTPKMARIIFEDLLASENVKQTPMNLHQSEGLMVCQGTETLTQCHLYNTKRKPSISFTNPITLKSSQYEDIIDYYASIGGFTNFEDRIVGTIKCNFIGLKSPPFGKETIDCQLQDPRFSNETIFHDTIAKSLSYYLIKEKGFKPGIAQANGTLRCTNIDKNPKCFVKATKTNRKVDLTTKDAEIVLAKILETAAIIKLTNPSFDVPRKRLFGAINCLMHFATQKFACRTKI